MKPRRKQHQSRTEKKPSVRRPKLVAPNAKVPVSWGELMDKITILDIKDKRLSSPDAVANVRRERALLRTAAGELITKPRIKALMEELRAVNEALWQIEDEIRAKEAAKMFDQRFIELARSVYIRNDERGALKREINAATNSAIVEEKQYTGYTTDENRGGTGRR